MVDAHAHTLLKRRDAFRFITTLLYSEFLYQKVFMPLCTYTFTNSNNGERKTV